MSHGIVRTDRAIEAIGADGHSAFDRPSPHQAEKIEADECS